MLWKQLVSNQTAVGFRQKFQCHSYEFFISQQSFFLFPSPAHQLSRLTLLDTSHLFPVPQSLPSVNLPVHSHLDLCQVILAPRPISLCLFACCQNPACIIPVPVMRPKTGCIPISLYSFVSQRLIFSFKELEIWFFFPPQMTKSLVYNRGCVCLSENQPTGRFTVTGNANQPVRAGRQTSSYSCCQDKANMSSNLFVPIGEQWELIRNSWHGESRRTCVSPRLLSDFIWNSS